MTCQSLLVSIVVFSFSLGAMGGAGISTTAGQYAASNALLLPGATSPTFYYSNVSNVLDGTSTYYTGANGGACSTTINPHCLTSGSGFVINAIDSVAISGTPKFYIIYSPSAVPAVGTLLSTGVVTSWAYTGANVLTPNPTISWSALCTQINNLNNAAGIDANCNQNGTDPTQAANVPLYLVADANGNATLDSGESVLPFNVVFQSTVPAASSIATSEGFYQWQAFPGDGECVIVNSVADTNFNNTAENGGTGAQFLQFFYVPGPDVYNPTNAVAATAEATFSTINLSSQNTGTGISVDANGNLIPAAVIPGLANGTNFYLKAAIVDNANNIGYLTPASDDVPTGVALNGAPIVLLAHACQPGQIAGLLSKNGNCFIATAAYGSPLATEVQIFREFRDRILMKTKQGQRFVRWYYHYGAGYADRIRNHDDVRRLVRAGLYPLLGFSWLALKLGAYNACLLIVTILLFPFLFFRFLSSRRKDDEISA